MFTVYEHRCTKSNKSYIGVTKNTVELRWAQKESKARNTNLKYAIFEAIRTYGTDCWEHNVLWQGVDVKEAYDKEIELIKKYNTYMNGYNSCLGGKIPNYGPLTQAHKKNITKGLLKAYETGRMLPTRHSDETKAKMRKIQQVGYWETPIGKFESRKEAALALSTSRTNISNWCKHKNCNIITQQTITRLPHIFYSVHLGQTYSQIGFSYEPI